MSKDGERIGSIALRDEGDDVLLYQFYLRPEYQRRDLGSRILAAVLEELDRVGRSVRLTVLKNSPAIRAYAFGFVPVGSDAYEYTMVRGGRSPARARDVAMGREVARNTHSAV